jgi:hypothetical protein
VRAHPSTQLRTSIYLSIDLRRHNMILSQCSSDVKCGEELINYVVADNNISNTIGSSSSDGKSVCVHGKGGSGCRNLYVVYVSEPSTISCLVWLMMIEYLFVSGSGASISTGGRLVSPFTIILSGPACTARYLTTRAATTHS